MILSWYRDQAKECGCMAGNWLLCGVACRGARVIARNRILSATVQCPCCGWRGRSLLDYIEMGYSSSNIECPNCGSHSRHRALFLWLRDEYQIKNRAGRAIIFASERALDPLWSAAENLKTYRVDLNHSRRVDVIADILRLPFCSRVADLIWCHHVLEQVEDDRTALRELQRLCTNSGELIVSVGTSAEVATSEFGCSDRKLSGNWRRYGGDFPERLEEAGFTVTPIDYRLSDSQCRAYGISRERFYLCKVSSNTLPH